MAACLAGEWAGLDWTGLDWTGLDCRLDQLVWFAVGEAVLCCAVFCDFVQPLLACWPSGPAKAMLI